MTAENRTALKALFETGDTLLQTSFEDLIDSFLNLTDTASQSVASDVTFARKVTFATPTVTTVQNITGNIAPSGDLVFTTVSINATGTTATSAAAIDAVTAILQSVSADSNSGVKINPPGFVGGTTTGIGNVRFIVNAVSATAMVYPVGGSRRIDGETSVKLMPNQRMIIFNAGSTSAYTMVGGAAGV